MEPAKVAREGFLEEAGLRDGEERAREIGQSGGRVFQERPQPGQRHADEKQWEGW